VSHRDFDESIYDVKNEDVDLYGANYWEKHFLKLANVGTMDELHDLYLSNRCLYWLRYLLKYALPSASIAEIGSGLGQLQYLVKQAGFEQVGVELSPKVCDLARQSFDIDMRCGTIDSLDGIYDVILCMDLLEHLVNPAAFMQKVTQRTSLKSILILQTPCYNPDLTFQQMRQVCPRFEGLLISAEHIFLFSHKSIVSLLKKAGFSHIQFEPAVFGDDYDMFLIASMSQLVEREQADILDALATNKPGGWMVRTAYQMQQNAEKQQGELQGQLSEVHQQLGTTQGQLSETQQQLSEAHQQLGAIQGQLSETQQQLSESQQQLSKTQQQLSESQQQLSESQQQMSKTQQQLSESQQQLCETQRQLGELHRQLGATRGQLSETQQLLAEKEREIVAVYTSRSWRITKPIRIISNIVRMEKS